MNKVAVAFGANLGDAKRTIAMAASELAQLCWVHQFKLSSMYETPPVGPQNQPNYVNAVASFSASIAPQAVLHHLQSLEQKHGRVRNGERWGPRTLDLDVLLYGDLTLDSKELCIPHPRMHERAFVLLPLSEIEPNWVIPRFGSVEQMLNTQPTEDVSAISVI
ncbi:MAG: 2-amino-4-hydroxy-6-hydroxymethyldihydropteridine diphosphokinase [Gammaproteobacteria bacterium]|nr:2-amino-4-hydroxy-6-hydroxymethyldihydropteridine diphosphokinase [Gammaproteobacteria bacterium]